MEKVSLTTAFNKFFGRKPGQSMGEFSAEIKAATSDSKDRADWVDMFATVGFDVS